MNDHTLGRLVRSFFMDHLQVAKGLQRSSVQSYRDVLRIFLTFVAVQVKCNITNLCIEELTYERVILFLRYLETDRHNSAQTRNQRLAVLHLFFDYLAQRVPEMLTVGE